MLTSIMPENTNIADGIPDKRISLTRLFLFSVIIQINSYAIRSTPFTIRYRNSAPPKNHPTYVNKFQFVVLLYHISFPLCNETAERKDILHTVSYQFYRLFWLPAVSRNWDILISLGICFTRNKTDDCKIN